MAVDYQSIELMFAALQAFDTPQAQQTQLDLSIQILDGLSRIIENIWKDIADYNRLTYMTITETTFVQHSDIESLDKRCYNWGCYISRLITSITEAENRMGYQHIVVEQFQTLKSKVKNLIRQHVQTIFVVGKQPKQVINVTKERQKDVPVSVLFLGLKSLQEFVQVVGTVSMNIIQQKDQSATHTLHSASTHAVQSKASFSQDSTNYWLSANVKVQGTQLYGIESRAKFKGQHSMVKGQKPSVSDVKVSMVFHSNVRIDGAHNITVTVLSVPFVLTSHTSQTREALGTLIWNAMFQTKKDVYHMDNEWSTVRWQDMKEFLGSYWKRRTTKELPKEQLDYLGFKLCSDVHSLEELNESATVTKQQFLNTLMLNCNCSFWIWFFACCNLVTEKRIKDDYCHNRIVGFLGRTQSELMLKQCVEDSNHNWVFLLRFRESDVNIKSQKQKVLATITVSLAYKHHGEIRYMHLDHIQMNEEKIPLHENGLRHTLTAMEADKQNGKRQPLLNEMLTLGGDIIDIERAFPSYQPDNDNSQRYLLVVWRLFVDLDNITGMPTAIFDQASTTTDDMRNDQMET